MNEDTPETAELTHGQLVGLLREAYSLREKRDSCARAYEAFVKLFREYLAAHPEEILRDGETGIEARLSRPPMVTEYDIADASFALIGDLYKAHLLQINKEGVKALPPGRLKDEIMKFRRTGEGTPRLTLEKKV